MIHGGTEQSGASTGVEIIETDGTLLALVVRAIFNPEETTFLTPDGANFQIGCIVKPSGVDVIRHAHRSIERNITGTAEFLLLRRGSCVVRVYDDARELASTLHLSAGDTVTFLGGGHSIEVLEDCLFLEVKQGPYPGRDEKQPF